MGQQVKSGGVSAASVSTQMRCWASSLDTRATSGPVSMRIRRRLATPETFEVVTVGAEVGGQAAGAADQADAAGEVQGGRAPGPRLEMIGQDLAHDGGRADAFLAGFFLQPRLTCSSTLTVIRSMPPFRKGYLIVRHYGMIVRQRQAISVVAVSLE